MIASGDLMSPSNPFATRFIRPGALRFIFPRGHSAESIVDALQAAGWRGEIIGPHGSGKSTLVAALMPVLESRGRRVRHFLFRRNSPKPQPDSLDGSQWDFRTQVVVDGYEQLTWFSRRRLQSACRKRGAGLLITSHQPCGLTTIYRTQTTLPLARAVVAALLPLGDTTISPADVALAYEETRGNLRETLFRLYDLYQERKG
jgi:hypothetical protein